MSHATSLYTVIQHLSLTEGVVAAALVLETAQFWRGEATLTVADFAIAYLVVGAIAITSLRQFTGLEADAGASVSGWGSRPLDK